MPHHEDCKLRFLDVNVARIELDPYVGHQSKAGSCGIVGYDTLIVKSDSVSCTNRTKRESGFELHIPFASRVNIYERVIPGVRIIV
jgi:hypothetical protein